MIGNDDYEKVEIASADALWDWLEINHTTADTVWLVTFKKAVPDKFVSTGEVLDALVAYGWTDGIRRKLDDERTMQIISRRKTEHWAKTYKAQQAISTTPPHPSAATSCDGSFSPRHSQRDANVSTKPPHFLRGAKKSRRCENLAHRVQPPCGA